MANIPSTLQRLTSGTFSVHKLVYDLRCAGYGAELMWIKKAKNYGVIANISFEDRWIAYVDGKFGDRKWIIKEHNNERINI